MKAAVLCPGPSVATTFKSRDGYELVAGVNRAVHRAPCDVWVALDPLPFTQIPATWFTTEATAAQLRGEKRYLAGGSIVEAERQFDQVPHELGGASWCTFSSTAAMVAMFLRGAKSIDVYGHDMTNQPDFDGASLRTNDRREDRWRQESIVWAVVTRWLADRGCVVNRITP